MKLSSFVAFSPPLTILRLVIRHDLTSSSLLGLYSVRFLDRKKLEYLNYPTLHSGGMF
jgi:hypothetical protein